MRTVRIHRIDPRETTPEQIRRDYVKGYVPFALKAAAAGWPAIRKWTPEFFASNYGADKISVRVKSAGVGAESVCPWTEEMGLRQPAPFSLHVSGYSKRPLLFVLCGRFPDGKG
jgi:hypothetical protein